MVATGGLGVLVPIDVSVPEAPSLDVIDHLGSVEVVLLGYFPVPLQAEPGLIRDEHEADAAARLDAIAAEHGDREEILVFTHDPGATIDRVADEHGCDAVLSPGAPDDDGSDVERVLVPVRGDVNLERILAVVAGLLEATGASATLFHAVAEDVDPSQAGFMLRGAVDRLVDLGVDRDRVEWVVAEGTEPGADIVERGADYDLVVLGETEPSIVERVMGEALTRIVEELDPPALVVRDVG